MTSFTRLTGFEPKDNKSIKVDLEDLYFLFSQIYDMNAHAPELQEQEDYSRTEYLFNKYLVCDELRREESMWYNAKQQIENKAPEGMTEEDREKQIREIFSFYIQAKHKREKLQHELQSKSM